MIDDLTPLHQLSADVAKRPHYLFKPKASYRMAQETLRGTAALRTQGENHPNGVVFHFYVKDWTDTAKAQLDLFELGGELIRSFSNTSKDRRTMLQVKKGGNRFVWDMRYPGFKDFREWCCIPRPIQAPKPCPEPIKPG